MGSKLGWIIAGAIVVVLLTVIVVSQILPPAATPPTFVTRDPNFFKARQFAAPLAPVIGYEPSGAGNAGDDYAKAADLCKPQDADIMECSRKLDDILNGRFQLDNLLPIAQEVDALAANGAKKKDMQYTTAKSLEPGFMQTSVQDLDRVACLIEELGAYYIASEKYEQALEVFKHMIVLGRHMMDERSTGHMMIIGIKVQGKAIHDLDYLYKHWLDHVKLANDLVPYADELVEMKSYCAGKAYVISDSQTKPGDLFNMAENEQDPAWRTQAILALGFIKYNATRGDKHKVNELLDRYASKGGPLEAAAAKAVQALTEQASKKLDLALPK